MPTATPITKINLTQQPTASFEPLSEIMTNAVKFEYLKIALEHDIFEHLQTPKTVDTLSKELGTHATLTAKLCNTLVAMGFIQRKADIYCNTPVSNTYLVQGSPHYQMHMINRNGNSTTARSQVSKALKEGPINSKSQGDYADIYSRDFILAMAETAVRGFLQKTVESITILPEFKTAKKMLDMGGGHGLYAIAMAQANPQLDAYVLDLPPVVESAIKEYISTYGMQDRVHAVPANFFTDDLGSGYDIVYASDVLYRATGEQRLAVLKKVAASLNKGGIFATRHWFLNADESGPLNVVEFDLRLSTMPSYGNMQFGIPKLNDFIDLLSQAGLVLRDVVDIQVFKDSSKLVIAQRSK
jgi:predicted O-methyltransferase YrrM